MHKMFPYWLADFKKYIILYLNITFLETENGDLKLFADLAVKAMSLIVFIKIEVQF